MAVLGQVAFGNVHVRHDLDAGNQGRVELPGGRGVLLQQSIDAVAQLHRVLEGHQVDVARPVPDGLGDNQVDQVDDRGLVGHHLDVVQVLALGGGAPLRVEILDHLLDRHLVALGQLLENLRCRDLGLPHLQPRQQPYVLDHRPVARLSRRYLYRAVLQCQRQNPVLLHKISRQCPHHLGRNLHLGQALPPGTPPTPRKTAVQLHGGPAELAFQFDFAHSSLDRHRNLRICVSNLPRNTHRPHGRDKTSPRSVSRDLTIQSPKSCGKNRGNCSGGETWGRPQVCRLEGPLAPSLATARDTEPEAP